MYFFRRISHFISCFVGPCQRVLGSQTVIFLLVPTITQENTKINFFKLPSYSGKNHFEKNCLSAVCFLVKVLLVALPLSSFGCKNIFNRLLFLLLSFFSFYKNPSTKNLCESNVAPFRTELSKLRNAEPGKATLSCAGR